MYIRRRNERGEKEHLFARHTFPYIPSARCNCDCRYSRISLSVCNLRDKQRGISSAISSRQHHSYAIPRGKIHGEYRSACILVACLSSPRTLCTQFPVSFFFSTDRNGYNNTHRPGDSSRSRTTVLTWNRKNEKELEIERVFRAINCVSTM